MMLSIITDAVISRGYDGSPAIYTSEDGQFLSFRIGSKVYDTRAPNNTRWVNQQVNVRGELVGRVQKMGLKEGSHINVYGAFDMRPNVNRETGEITSYPTIRSEGIEYASGAKPRPSASESASAEHKPTRQADEPPDPFLGYRPFGTDNPYYPE